MIMSSLFIAIKMMVYLMLVFKILPFKSNIKCVKDNKNNYLALFLLSKSKTIKCILNIFLQIYIFL